MNEEEEKLEIHVHHPLPGVEEDTAVVQDDMAVDSVVSATDTGEGKEEQVEVDAEDPMLGLLSSGSVEDVVEVPEEFDNRGMFPKEQEVKEGSVHPVTESGEDPAAQEDDVHVSGGEEGVGGDASQLEILDGGKDEILVKEEKEVNVQVGEEPIAHAIDDLHLTKSATEEKNGTAAVLLERSVGNEDNFLLGVDADVSVNLHDFEIPNVGDKKDVKLETSEGDKGDATISDSYGDKVSQSDQQEADISTGPGYDILTGDAAEMVVLIPDFDVGSATKERVEKAVPTEVGNAEIMYGNVEAREGGQLEENEKMFTESSKEIMQTCNAKLTMELSEFETRNAVEGKYENVESAEVDNHFVMRNSGEALKIEGNLHEEVEKKDVVGSSEELATFSPKFSTKESENDKLIQEIEGVEAAEKADGSEADSLMLDETIHLETVDENKQVEADRPLHVERTIMDGKEDTKEFSQSDIMEEAGRDVEMKESEGEEIIDYNVEEESQVLGSPMVVHPEEVLSTVVDEDTVVEDLQEDVDDKDFTSLHDSGGGTGRKKRGRPPKTQAHKSSSKKKVAEDVCFICFDGGNLVVCDRRGCPKVYHPSCVNRDEAFFRAKGRWNCGWHLCSICEKASQYMCYTCTYSLCKGCIKETEFACIRGNKGLCESCRSTVILIETTNLEQKTVVNFDDKTSWEYLFKDYWLDLKEKLSLTLDDVTQAKKPSKRSSASIEQSSDERYEANNVADCSSDSSSGHRERSKSKKKRVNKRSRVKATDENSVNLDNVKSSLSGDSDWGSKELLEFVSHMRNGDTSVLSQFDVQPLLLEYIKRNNLRDPRKKSYIICDKRLERLFGKARVGHFEMLKLLESHFLVKEASQVSMEEDIGASGDPDTGAIDAEGSSDAATKISDKRYKSRKKGGKGSLTNSSDYAAVDVHNINLVYLRRNLMEELLDDTESFSEKVIGCFVKIRISGAGQKQDMYRLVQVTGTTRAAEKYKTGKRTTDISLEILNLSKTEVVSIDSISNQEFTEEECKRLRQSIKCGLIRSMTVGDLQEKAMTLQAIRVNDWLESEKLRLGHLRDRASETGRRKELRECVEKLQLLSTPEELSRRLSEVPDIHTDPKMDPSYESAEDDSDDKRKESYSRPRDSGSTRKGRELSSGRNLASHNSWNAGRNTSTDTYEQRNAGRDTSNYSVERANKPIETPANISQTASLKANAWSNSQSLAVSSQSSVPAAHSSLISQSTTRTVISTASSVDEAEKMWHYQDPSGKVQGPFSIVQLRKWNSTGYFPRDLKIWKSSETQNDSIILTDALAGKFQKEFLAHSNSPSAVPFSVKPHHPPSVTGLSGTGVDTGAQTGNAWKSIVTTFHSSDHDRQLGNSSVQLPSSGNWNTQMENGSSHKLPNNSESLLTPTARPSTGGWSGSHVLDNKASVLIQPVTARWDVPTNLEVSISPSGVGNHHHSSAPRLPSQPAVPVTERNRKTEDGFVFSSKNAANENLPNVTGNKSFSEMAIDVRANVYPSPIYPSPTPNSQQKSSPGSDHQKSLSSSLKRNPDVTSFDLSESVTHKFQTDGVNEPQKQFQKLESIAMPHKVSSGDWMRINDGLSMPSPTPTTDSTALEAGVTVVPGRNPSAHADNSRNLAFSQRQVMPPYTSDQTIRSREHQDAGRSASENNNNNTGTAENSINVGRGTSLQGNTNISWGAVAQGTPGVGWPNQLQGSANMGVGWGPAAQVNPMASAMWSTPGPGNTSTNNAGWIQPMQGNPNSNALWGTATPVNVHLNSNWLAPQGYPNLNTNWIAPSQPVQANANMNTGWAIPTQGNSNINAGYGPVNVSTNPNWNAPSANTNNWNANTDKDRNSGHTDRRFQSSDSGFGGGSGRERMPPGPGGSSGQPDGGGQRGGICKYHESGHCKKGYSCNFLHS